MDSPLLQNSKARDHSSLTLGTEWEYPGAGTVLYIDDLPFQDDSFCDELSESTLSDLSPPSSINYQQQSVIQHEQHVQDPPPLSFDHKNENQTIISIKKTQSLHSKREVSRKNKRTLGQLRSTAIAGNDITSSIFYTMGVAALTGQQFTPICMILVVAALWCFKNTYSEVVTALPLNGGTYNVLLNTTSKPFASAAAALSLLSYLATAVVSANTAASYAATLFYENSTTPAAITFIYWVTIGILGVFALLNLCGLSESATVATIIFLLHLTTLTVLSAVSIWRVVQDFSMYKTNWEYPLKRPIPLAIYFGYSTALLGVSGFESSANYVEEQKPGVYPKTLRNMWLCIAIFNPLISILALGLLSVDAIVRDYNSVLANMAVKALNGQKWLSYCVVADAGIVLSGGVLTSYVGVTGLVRNMSSDRCLPQFLLQRNSLRNTNHWIILGFFGLTASLVVITNNNVQTLGGVYTIAFLSVMSLFAIGNFLLKYKRSRLPRQIHAHWLVVLLGLLAVLAGLIGNIIFEPIILAYFAIYFTGVMIIVFIMFARVRLLRLLLHIMKRSCLFKYCGGWIQREAKKIKSQPVIFFAKEPKIDVLNKAVLYVLENEITENLKIVHVYSPYQAQNQNAEFETNVKILDKIYPKLKIDLVLIKGEFTPRLVDEIEKRFNIAKNFMFITCPSEKFQHSLDKFGGVRIITH